MAEKITVKEASRDRIFTTYLIDELSVEEMDFIFNPNEKQPDIHDRLVTVLEKHNPGLGTSWRWGYGIYDIKHFGGNLLVMVGNSCD